METTNWEDMRGEIVAQVDPELLEQAALDLKDPAATLDLHPPVEDLRWFVAEERAELAAARKSMTDDPNSDLDPGSVTLSEKLLVMMEAALNFFATDPENPVVKAALDMAVYCRQVTMDDAVSRARGLDLTPEQERAWLGIEG